MPVHTDVFPMAALSHMVEVIAMEERVIVPRSHIYDVAFIVPLADVKSGFFYMH
jgi:hypothetical protein